MLMLQQLAIKAPKQTHWHALADIGVCNAFSPWPIPQSYPQTPTTTTPFRGLRAVFKNSTD